jgi:hypothetical protein
MPSISWYVNRARAMSFDEVLFRLRFQFKKISWKKKLESGSIDRPAKWIAEPVVKDPWPETFIKPENHEAVSLIEEADSYLNHEWLFFGLECISESEINWHKDPVSGKSAPLKFGYSINHRDESLVGNIKLTWEKNRHHHLTVLALAYHLTDKEKYAKEVVDQIQSWIEQNPFLLGVNWTHPLEQGIRLISWVWCERLLRSSKYYNSLFSKDSEFWNSVYHHQEYIEQTYSRGSSANNHLIGEMAGLYIASTAWPWFDSSKRWQKLSKALLEKEIINQTFESGINKELAFSYHIFVLEFYLLSLFEASLTDDRFSSDTINYLKKMVEVIPQLTDLGGNLPRFGDGDEGMAIQLQSLDGKRDEWLLQLGDVLLNTNTLQIQPPTLPFLLFNLSINNIEAETKEPLPEVKGYQDAGVYLLSNNRGEENELFVIADAGPLGYLSIAAHGHADALSFTLSFGGIPFIIDPGTFVYHTDYKWRKYFRGTSAHNTVMISGQDQSEQAGSFLWTNKANVTLEKWDADQKLLIASHDGYFQRYKAIHKRSFKLIGQTLTIEDFLTGRNEVQVENRLHFHPDCTCKLLNKSLKVTNGDKVLILNLPDNFECRIAKGEESAGWYSPSFDKKVILPTLIVSKGSVQLPVSFKTIINTNKD